MKRNEVPPGFLRRAAPSLLSAPIAAAGFVVLQRLDLISDIALWQLLLVLGLSTAAGVLAFEVWPRTATVPQLYARALVSMLAVSAVIYATGWGPAMGIGFGFQGALEIRRSGARAAGPAAIATVVAILAGEIAIRAGIAPTQIPQPQVHGIAALVAAGAVLMILMLGDAEESREHAEQRTRRSEEVFRSLVENAADAVVLTDAEGSVVYASPATRTRFGFDLAGLQGAPTAGFVHPDHLETAGRYLASVLATPGPHPPVELLCRIGDGSWRWLEVRCTNRLDDPVVAGIVANVTDVHDRKVAAEQVGLQSARWEALVRVISEMGIGFFVCDSRRVAYANDAMATLTGRPVEELLAMPSFDEIVVPEQREMVRERLRMRLAGEDVPEHYETTIAHASGRRAEVAVAAKAVDLGGERQVVVTMSDITERVRTEEALRTFIANAAHELRTPLTTLVGVASTLANHASAMTEEEFRQSLMALRRQGERTSGLIQSLLDLSRAETGPVAIELENVDLASAVSRAAEASAPPEGARIEPRIPPGTIVRAEPTRLEQVLVNLFTNAYRYGGDNITVEARRNGHHVVATVADDGPGVPAQLIASMFDPFSRGPGTQDTPGSGLGLAICRASMDAMGGSIEYRAGDGACFVLRFEPATAEPPTAP